MEILTWQAVLIETLWNVKKRGIILTTTATSVLIETLWNVKKEAEQVTQPVTMF